MIYKRIKTIDEIIEEKIKYMRYTGIKSIDERIGKKIEEANKRKYFVPRELHECNQLIPEVEKIIKDYKDALKPWYRTSWSNAEAEALSVAWEAALENYGKAVLRDVGNAAWNAALEAARRAVSKAALGSVWWDAFDDALRAVCYTTWDATWELVRDIEGCENNPFEKIVLISDMGLLPRGFNEVDGTEKFIVDFPLKTREAGCWREGEEEILYKHRWNESCYRRRPVKLFARIFYYLIIYLDTST
jgi:hypothetical protein